MNSKRIKLDRDDVYVEELSPVLCDDCEVAKATHQVFVEFRSAGMGQYFGKYCEKCAKEVASRIKSGLPR
jgi:methionyl-tRNA synthetase